MCSFIIPVGVGFSRLIWCFSPLRYLALYAYKPQKADELELRKGEMYRVTEKCQDGWFKGTSLRTAASGVFPGNYVTPVSRSVGCSQRVEGVLSLSVNDPAPAASGCNPSHWLWWSIIRALLFCLHTKEEADIMQQLWFTVSFFSQWLRLLRNNASRSSGIRRLRATTAILVAPCNCGRCLCSTWHKDVPQKKKRTFQTRKICECPVPWAIMTRSAASLHSLPSFVGISAFTSATERSKIIWSYQTYILRSGQEQRRSGKILRRVSLSRQERGALLTRSHLGQTWRETFYLSSG